MGGYLMSVNERETDKVKGAARDETLVDLQTRLAFQDQAITELNDVIADQQQQLDQLREQLRMLNDKLIMLEESVETEQDNEKPPHY